MKPNIACSPHRCPLGLALVVVVAWLAGCGNKSTSDRNLVFVTPSEADTLVQGRRRLLGIAGTTQGVWLDPRTEREFREGHIRGAMHIPAEDLRDRHQALDGFDLVIVYGDTYNDPLAIAVSKGLIELGHDARTLRGGLRAWEASGNTLVQGDAAPPAPPAGPAPAASGR